MLGKSWVTSVLGYVIAALVELEVLVREGGLPGDMIGWIQMALGIVIAVFGRKAKDADVTGT